MRRAPLALMLSAALLPACANSSSSSSSQGTQVPLRATNGPVSRPTPISTPTDRDNDRVPDANDACPNEPGGLRDGCPVVDTDGDGISDRFDKCPSVPELRDGRADGDGCPGAAGS